MEIFKLTSRAIRSLYACRTAAIAAGLAVALTASLTIPSHVAVAQDQTLSSSQVAAVQNAVVIALGNIDPNLTGEARTSAINEALAQVAVTQIGLDGPAALAQVVSVAIAANVPAAQAVQALLPASIAAGVAPAAAISTITVAAVSAGASPAVTTEAVIAVAVQTATPSATVGSGLGQAAATLSQTSNSGAASQVALVVANQAPAGTSQSFGASVVAAGAPQQLAATAQQPPSASSTTGSTVAPTINTFVPVTTALPTIALAPAAATIASGAVSPINSAGVAVTCLNPSCN